MIFRSLRVAALSTLVFAGTASAAADNSVTASLTPDAPLAASAASVTIQGPFSSGSAAPTGLSVQLQRGFTSSVKSVATLCSASDGAAGTCPSASDIGSGSVVATISTFGTITVPLTLAEGAPSETGDISTLYLHGSYDGYNFESSARLFRPTAGGLEILFAAFPAPPAAAASIPVSVQSISFAVKAKRTLKKTVTKTVGTGKHKHKVKKTTATTNSFLTNPPACSSTRTWTGSASVTSSSGVMTLPFSAPCT
jgi:hypothetical protein